MKINVSFPALLALLLGAWVAGLWHRSQQTDYLLPYEDEVPELDPDLLYERCPDCLGEAGGCLTCFDLTVIPHDCA